MNLETLILEFGADFAALDDALNKSSQKARKTAADIEKTFKGLNANIIPKVDHSPLNALNEHLNLKERHYDKLNQKVIRPRVNLEELDKLEKKIKTISFDTHIKIKANISSQSGTIRNSSSSIKISFSNDINKLIRVVEHQGARLVSEVRASYKKGGIIGAAGRLIMGTIALPFKATASVLRDVVRGYFERIGQEFSNTWSVEPSRNAAKKISLGVKKIDKYLLGQNQILETLFSEILRSGNISKAFEVSFQRTNLNKDIERLQKLQEIALIPADKIGERLQAINKSPELKIIFENAVKKVAENFSNLSKKDQGKKALEVFLADAQPKTIIEQIVNPLIQELSPFLRFIQGMRAYRTSVESQRVYNERKAGFPILKENENVVSVIGGAQFKGGQGGRQVAQSIELLAPQSRFIPVENLETDVDKRNRPPLENWFIEQLKAVAPDFAEGEAFDTAVNAFRQFMNAINPLGYSTAAAQAIANTRLAEEQGKKGSVVSYSLGGADNIQYAQTAQYMGMQNISALAMAYPFLDFTQNTPLGFNAAFLSNDPISFPTLLGLGNQKSNQSFTIPGNQAFGLSNHHQKHLFKNIEFLNLFFHTIGENIPNISSKDISKIVDAGDKLYEMLGSVKQLESLLTTGDFDLNMPYHRFMQGYTSGNPLVSAGDLMVKVGEAHSMIQRLEKTPGAEESVNNIINLINPIIEEIRNFFKAKGANLPENPSDFAGYLKYNQEAPTYQAILDLVSGQEDPDPKKQTWFAGEFDIEKVKERTSKIKSETIPWFRREGGKFGKYQDKLISLFQLLDLVTTDFVKNQGKVSEQTKKKVAETSIEPFETFSPELTSFLNKMLDTSVLPKEEESRELQVDIPKIFRKKQSAILAYNKIFDAVGQAILPNIEEIKAIGAGMSGAVALMSDKLVYKTDLDPSGAKKIGSENEIKAYQKLEGRLSPLLYSNVPGEALITERIKGRPLKDILDRIAKPYKLIQEEIEKANILLEKTTENEDKEKLQARIRELRIKARTEKSRFNKAAAILYKQVGQLGATIQEMGVVHNDLASGNVFFTSKGITSIDLGNASVNPTSMDKFSDQFTTIQRAVIDREFYGLMDPLAIIAAIRSGYSSPLPIPEKRNIDKTLLSPSNQGEKIPLGSYTPTLLKQVTGDFKFPDSFVPIMPINFKQPVSPTKVEKKAGNDTNKIVTALKSIEQILTSIEKAILAKYASSLSSSWENNTSPDFFGKSEAELKREKENFIKFQEFINAINKSFSQKFLPPAPDGFGNSGTDKGSSPLEKVLEDISIKAQAGLKSALTTRLSTPDSQGEIQILTGNEDISDLLNQVLIREIKDAGRMLGDALKNTSLDIAKFGQTVFTVLKAIEKPVMDIPGMQLGKKAIQLGGTVAIGSTALHALPFGLDTAIIEEMRAILSGAMSAGGQEMIRAVASQMTKAFGSLPFGVGQQLTEAVTQLVTEIINGTISVLSQGGAVAGSALMAGEGVKKLLGAATSNIPQLISKEEQQKIEGKTQKVLKAAKSTADSLITTEITPYFDKEIFPVSTSIPDNINAIKPEYYTIKQLRGLARDQGINVPASGTGAKKEEIWKSLTEKFNPDQLARLLLTTKASDRTQLGQKELGEFQIATKEITADFIDTIGKGIKNITQQINTNKDIQSLNTFSSQLEKIKTQIALIRANPEFDTTNINKSLNNFVTSIDQLLLKVKNQIQSFLPATESNLQANLLPATETLSPLQRVPEENSPISPGWVGKLSISDLNLDPERFQYKLVHGKTGSTGSLSGVGKWDDDLAGVVSVWRDPKDGKVYVVNGHNRLNLAKDLNVKDITVRLLNAQSAQEARAKGAMINIAEGRGTAIDAAKFLRDMNLADKESLKKAGIPMRDRVASQGLALAQLPQELFDRVASGDIPELRGVQIGSSGLKEFQQRELVKLIENFEKKGKKITESVVSELIDTFNASTVDTVEQFDLFGSSTTQQTDVLTRAEVQSALRNRIATDKRVFGSLTSDKKAAKLKTAGNQINTEENKAIAEQAEQALRVFDQLKNTASPVSSIINEAITLINEQSMTAKEAADAVYDKLKQIVPQLAKGGLESGKNLNEGLAKGLKDNDAEKIVKENAQNIIDELNDGLGNKSPSWKGKEAGENLIKGAGIGIEKEKSRLITKIKELTTKVVKELQKGLSNPTLIKPEDVVSEVPTSNVKTEISEIEQPEDVVLPILAPNVKTEISEIEQPEDVVLKVLTPNIKVQTSEILETGIGGGGGKQPPNKPPKSSSPSDSPDPNSSNNSSNIPVPNSREEILKEWEKTRDNIVKGLDDFEQSEGLGSGFTEGITNGLKVAIANVDGFINALSSGGKALRTLDLELNRVTSGMFNLRKAGMAVIGGFALFKGAELLLQPLMFALEDIPFKVQQVVTDSLLAFTDLQRIEINLKLAGISNVSSEIDRLKERANELGISFKESARLYGQFKIVTTGTPLQNQSDNIFEGIQTALSARQTNPEQQAETFRAINQIAGKSRLSVEEFTQQLSESGGLTDALNVAARSMGLTTAAFYEQTAAGNLLSQDVLPRLAAEYERMSLGGIGKASQTLQSEMNRFANATENLQMELGESLGVIAYPSLQLLNTVIKGIADNLNLILSGALVGVSSLLVFLGKSVLQFAAAIRLGQLAISSYSAALFAMGITAGQTATKLQMVTATARVAGMAIMGAFKAMIVPAAVIASIQGLFAVINAGNQEVKDGLKSLKESGKVLEDLGKIEPQQRKKGTIEQIVNPDQFEEDITQGNLLNRVKAIFTWSPFREAGKVGFDSYSTSITLDKMTESLEEVQTNLKGYQSLLSDTGSAATFTRSLQDIRNKLALVRAQRDTAPSDLISGLNQKEQELIKQETELIDKTFGSSGARITADIQTLESNIKSLQDLDRKGAISQDEYTTSINKYNDALAKLKASEKDYLEILKDQEAEYKRLQFSLNRVLAAKANADFAIERRSLRSQIEDEKAFASGKINEYEFNLKDSDLATAKEKLASLVDGGNNLGKDLAGRITNSADQVLTEYFKKDLAKLGVGSFADAIAKNALSPEAIDQVMGEYEQGLASNAALKSILTTAKEYASVRQNILSAEKEIATITREIAVERQRRQIAEKQAAVSIQTSDAKANLARNAISNQDKNLSINQTKIDLANLYGQLAIDIERLNNQVGREDPLPIRQNISSLRQQIEETKLNLRTQLLELEDYYRNLDRQIQDFNRQLFDFNRQLEDTRLSAIREVRTLNESYSDLVRELDKNILDLSNQLEDVKDKIKLQQLKNQLIIPGASGLGRELNNIILEYLQSEADSSSKNRSFESRIKEVESNYLASLRRIRDLQEQQSDAERNRLRTIKDIQRSQEDLVRSLSDLIRNTQRELGSSKDSINRVNSEISAIAPKVQNSGEQLAAAIKGVADSVRKESNNIVNFKKGLNQPPRLIDDGRDITIGTKPNQSINKPRERKELEALRQPPKPTPLNRINQIRRQQNVAKPKPRQLPKPPAVKPPKPPVDTTALNRVNQIRDRFPALQETPSLLNSLKWLEKQANPNTVLNGLKVLEQRFKNDASNSTAINTVRQLINRFQKDAPNSTIFNGVRQLIQIFEQHGKNSTGIRAFQELGKQFQRLDNWFKDGVDRIHRFFDPNRPQRRSSVDENQLYASGISDMGMYELKKDDILKLDPDSKFEKFIPSLGDLPPIPEFNFNVPNRQVETIQKLGISLIDAEKTLEQLNQEMAKLTALDQLIETGRQITEAWLSTKRAVRDSIESVADLTLNAKGYLTVQEQIKQAGIDVARQYRSQLESLQDQRKALEFQIDSNRRNLEMKILLLAQVKNDPEIANEYQKQIDALTQSTDDYVNQLSNLDGIISQVENNRGIAVRAAEDQEALNQAYEALDKYNSLMADLADRREMTSPLAAIFGGGGDRLRIESDYRKRAKELSEDIRRGLYTPEQAREMTAALQEMADTDLTKAFVDANPVASGLRDIIKGAVTDFENLGQTALNVLESIANKLLDNGLNMLLGNLFGGGGIKNLFGRVGNIGNAGGGLGNLFGGGMGSLFTGASTFSLGTLPAFVPGFAYGGSLDEAMQKERNLSGKEPVLSVLHQGEEVLSTLNQDAQFYRALKRSGQWNELKTGSGVQSFATGGTVRSVQVDNGGSSNQRMAYAQTTVYNITTPNADSFRKSQAQLIEERERRNREQIERYR